MLVPLLLLLPLPLWGPLLCGWLWSATAVLNNPKSPSQLVMFLLVGPNGIGPSGAPTNSSCYCSNHLLTLLLLSLLCLCHCLRCHFSHYSHVTSSATLLMLRIKSRQGRPLERSLYWTCYSNTRGQYRKVFPKPNKVSQQPAYIARWGLWQGCLHQSWQSPHAIEGLCWHQSWHNPCHQSLQSFM
jgi:hypothetical protein